MTKLAEEIKKGKNKKMGNLISDLTKYYRKRYTEIPFAYPGDKVIFEYFYKYTAEGNSFSDTYNKVMIDINKEIDDKIENYTMGNY